MDPVTLIPTPDALQVPWGWFQLLLLITLFLHLILMNIMLGTSFIAFINHFRSPEESNPLCHKISKILPFAIAFTVNFGIAPLLFVQVLYGNYLYTSSVLMAVAWMSVIGLLIVGYYTSYIYKYKYEELGSSRVVVTGLSVLTLLLIGFFMSNNFTMMQRPDTWVRYFASPEGLLLNLGDPTLFPRYFHFITAAIAIGGLSIALYYEYKNRKGDITAKQWIQSGLKWFGYATIVNFGFGFWFFGILAVKVIDLNGLAGVLITLFLFAGIALGAMAVIFSFQGKTLPVLYSILPTVFLMILVRDLVRVEYLKAYSVITELPTDYQYSPFLVFLLFFIGGLLLLGWMLKLVWKTYNGEEVQS